MSEAMSCPRCQRGLGSARGGPFRGSSYPFLRCPDCRLSLLNGAEALKLLDGEDLFTSKGLKGDRELAYDCPFCVYHRIHQLHLSWGRQEVFVEHCPGCRCLILNEGEELPLSWINEATADPPPLATLPPPPPVEEEEAKRGPVRWEILLPMLLSLAFNLAAGYSKLHPIAWIEEPLFPPLFLALSMVICVLGMRQIRRHPPWAFLALLYGVPSALFNLYLIGTNGML